MFEHVSEIGKALSDPARVTMLHLVWQKEKISCQELSKHFALSQPTISHHVGKLADAKLIHVEKRGTSHTYSVNTQFLETVGIRIDQLLGSKNS